MIEPDNYINGDCMDYLPQYPNGYFDLAIVDPPYGLNIDGQKQSINKNPQHNRKAHKKQGWDSTTPAGDYFRELERVSRNQIIWGGNYFVAHLQKGTKGWIIWDKGQRGLTMSDCELAYSSFNKPTRIVTLNRVELLKEGTIHPTQKPVKLYEWLIANYAAEGDIILDTHVGSGSSLIACHNTRHKYVGFEKNAEIYEASKERLDAVRAQMTIWDFIT